MTGELASLAPARIASTETWSWVSATPSSAIRRNSSGRRTAAVRLSTEPAEKPTMSTSSNSSQSASRRPTPLSPAAASAGELPWPGMSKPITRRPAS